MPPNQRRRRHRPHAPRRPAAPRTPEIVGEVEIESIAAGGDGVGRIDGRVVFVPRTAPGDRAQVRYAPTGRFTRGALVAVEHPSPVRVDPPCPHYTRDRCGGCQLQHLDLDAQHAAKVGIVRDALTRIGRMTPPAITITPSPRAWRYRQKLTLTLRRQGEGWIAGLHRYDAPDEIFQLEDCPITDERVLAAWRDVLAASPLFPEGATSLRAAVRTTRHGTESGAEAGGFALIVEGGARWPAAESFRAAVPALTELWWIPDRGRRQRLYSRAADGAAGASFVQVNPSVAEAMHAYVVERTLAYDPTTVVDAYAGTGATAVRIAERGVRVVAIESDREAAAIAARALAGASRVVVGRVEDVLSEALPADVVILNPPRAGVDAAVTAKLTEPRPLPRAILYVSCNPATLARDVARLAAYRVVSVQAFDMFPQTAHVEVVCELVPMRSVS